jgi:hypothetical protein
MTPQLNLKDKKKLLPNLNKNYKNNKIILIERNLFWFEKNYKKTTLINFNKLTPPLPLIKVLFDNIYFYNSFKQ